MKKIHLTLLGLAVVLISFTSCEKENDTFEENTELQLSKSNLDVSNLPETIDGLRAIGITVRESTEILVEGSVEILVTRPLIKTGFFDFINSRDIRRIRSIRKQINKRFGTNFSLY